MPHCSVEYRPVTKCGPIDQQVWGPLLADHVLVSSTIPSTGRNHALQGKAMYVSCRTRAAGYGCVSRSISSCVCCVVLPTSFVATADSNGVSTTLAW